MIPMGEFWAGSNGTLDPSVKMASSVGHIYGRNGHRHGIFHGRPEHGRWLDDPYSFKALGDLVYCEGINRLHLSPVHPSAVDEPISGHDDGAVGHHFDRTNTWFEAGAPGWIISPAASFCCNRGISWRMWRILTGKILRAKCVRAIRRCRRGYDFDAVNAHVLMDKSSVKITG
jgi:hypothetical protein